ncbi:hypothetical protein [Streptomyces violaceusniger]
MDIAGQLLLHGVARPRGPIARHVGRVGEARGGRGGGAEPGVQLTHQVALEQDDGQGVAAEQGDHEQQQGDRQQPTAQWEPAAQREPTGR